jgi:Cu-Zn family superoxide dismutase
MKPTIVSVTITAVVIAAGLSAQHGPMTATAELKNASGTIVGKATLTDTPHGVLMSVSLNGVAPGLHALHFHTTGKCEPPFESAGAHFNPTKMQHGLKNEKGMHAGDLLNADMPAAGAYRVEIFARDVTLAAGPKSLLDADGSALILHDKGDDYATDPGGAAGDRIACGVVNKP